MATFPNDNDLIDDLVTANKILVDQRFMEAYGHISARHPNMSGSYWMSRALTPSAVTHDDILKHDLDGNPVTKTDAKLYFERVIHGEIYKARPDVMCVIHSHCESLIPFCNTDVKLRPMVGNAAFLAWGPPVFDIREVDDSGDLNVCTPEQGRGLAKILGEHALCLIRGHGVVVVGTSIREAVRRAVISDNNARLQLQALPLGPVKYLTDTEIAYARIRKSRDPDRSWDLWKGKALNPLKNTLLKT